MLALLAALFPLNSLAVWRPLLSPGSLCGLIDQQGLGDVEAEVARQIEAWQAGSKSCAVVLENYLDVIVPDVRDAHNSRKRIRSRERPLRSSWCWSQQCPRAEATDNSNSFAGCVVLTCSALSSLTGRGRAGTIYQGASPLRCTGLGGVQRMNFPSPWRSQTATGAGSQPSRRHSRFGVLMAG